MSTRIQRIGSDIDTEFPRLDSRHFALHMTRKHSLSRRASRVSRHRFKILVSHQPQGVHPGLTRHPIADWTMIQSEHKWSNEKYALLKSMDERHRSLWFSHRKDEPFIDWQQLVSRDSEEKPISGNNKTKDWKERTEFAKSIGLPDVPSQTVDSFNQLYGLLDSIMNHDSEHDSVTSVRRIRRG